MKPDEVNDSFSEEEVARRRDEVIRRMANTPPQPRISPPSRQPETKKPTGAHPTPRKPRAAGKAP
jgi:hypothetical protein